MKIQIWSWAGSLFLFSFAHAGVVVFSGGDSPESNHFSQYLQTKSLAEGLGDRLGSGAVSVAFGAGNRTDRAPILADVVRFESMMYQGDEYPLRTFMPGAIENNHEASREQIRNLLSRQARSEEPLFVLVSDHGSPNREQDDPEFENNCINLWAVDSKSLERSTGTEACYSRKKMEEDFSRLPAKKIIYGMSQCFSGGFHRMSVKRDSSGEVRANPNLCGFAASTPDLTSSGCMDRVDGEKYAGYERFFTSQILGEDFVSHEKTGYGPATTLREAHVRATLQDFVGDVPNSTSEFYLTEILKSLRETKSNRNFRRRFKPRNLLRKIEYFSNPETGDTDFKKKNAGTDALLYLEMSGVLRRWVENAKTKGLPDAETLLMEDTEILLKEQQSLERTVGERSKELELLHGKIKHIQEIVFKAPERMERIRVPLLDELGLRNLYDLHGEDLFNQAPLVATSDPIAGRLIQLFKAVRIERIRTGLEKEYLTLPVETIEQLEERETLYATYLDRSERLEKAQLRYRLLRSLLMRRSQLGVLGTALQTKSAEILETYRALVECESTPLK